MIDAFWVATKAHEEVRAAYAHQVALQRTVELAQASGHLEGMPNRKTMNDARRKIEQALANAETADGALIKIIRDELRSKPEAVMQPIDLPANRRRI